MLDKQNIFLVGAMGAGKTTIGRYLAQELGRPFYDSDLVIEQRTGVSLNWIFDLEGEAGFREREIKIIDELTQCSNIVLATGGGSVLKETNRQNLSARGVVIHLKTTIDQQMVRTEKDKKRPLLQNLDNKRTKLEDMAQIREQLYEQIADLTFRTDESSIKNVAEEILETLRNRKLP